MKPAKIKDANRKLPSDPNYNPRTVFIPEEFKQKLTPVKIQLLITVSILCFILMYFVQYNFLFQAVRQWWELKSQHFDCILFFKVGKFYEMYHMDAVTAAKELNLLYMRVRELYKYFVNVVLY